MSTVDVTAWVGRVETTRDQITQNLVRRIAATLGARAPSDGEDLPALWHWAFFQDTVPEGELGVDGHPRLGRFLPPAEHRNRMWAGSRITFVTPLKVGALVERKSTIIHVEEKVGSSGSLLFVTIRHEHLQDGEIALLDEQDIVYRSPSPPKLTSPEPLPAGDWSEAVTPSPTLLFRYSAVTFNGHRIHYDWPYVTETEGYPGLVVHGPLIATLSLSAFVRANPGINIKTFKFRGVRPLIVPTTFDVGGKINGVHGAHLWAGNGDGIAQLGEVEFDQGTKA